MISNLIRKLLSTLSIFFRNTKVNKKKDNIILDEIKYLIRFNKKNSNLENIHKIFNDKMYKLLSTNKLENFLRENFIQKMFFVHNRLFILSELKALKQNKNWKFYKYLIKEDSIGNPIRYFLYSQSSGNR